MKPFLSIRIDFQSRAKTEPESVSLAPEDYFDLDPGEQPDLDCVPKHYHAADYLLITLEELVFTRVTLFRSKDNASIQITETFWNRGSNRTVERIDLIPDNPYWELIVISTLQEHPPVVEILRLIRNGELISPVSHVIITSREDGSQVEKAIVN